MLELSLSESSEMSLAAAEAMTTLTDDPATVEEAKYRPDWHLWEQAIKTELENHRQNNTWTLSKLPEGRRTVSARFVLHVKRNADGTVNKYKARLVARGFSQQQGIDYAETFSPVVRSGTTRLIIALAAICRFHIHQMDVTAAFLNGDVQEEIYMIQPPGMEDNSGRVCKLNKAIYGLKQASRVWYQRLSRYLFSNQYRQISSDQGLFFKHRYGSIVLCVYFEGL